MKIALPLIAAGAILLAALGNAPCAFAQIKDNGPASLVITYKSTPANRAAFRSFVETKGADAFAKWKAEGVFEDFRILFSPYEVSGGIDMAVILDFHSFSDSERWKDIEKRMPGGLSAEGLALGGPDDTVITYPLSRSGPSVAPSGKSAFVLGGYQVTVDMPKYETYAKGYIVPQLKGWIENGAMSSYAIYIRQPYQNPSSTVWTSLLVLEYTDMISLARSDIVKDEVRKKLAGDPSWKAFSDNKQEMRKAQGFIFMDAIAQPAR